MSRLRRWLRAILLGLVVTAEILEGVEHLLHDGHLPHSPAHLDARAEPLHESAEHGCSPLAHRCSCHASQSATPPAEPRPIARASNGRRLPTASDRDPRAHGVAPPLPPPIA